MIIFNHHVYREPWQHNKHNQTFPLLNCIRGLALPESRAGKCRASWHQAAPVTGKGGKLPALCQCKAHAHTLMQTPNYSPISANVVFKPFSTEDVAVGGAFYLAQTVAMATKQLSMEGGTGMGKGTVENI